MHLSTVTRFLVSICCAISSIMLLALTPVQAKSNSVSIPAIVVDANNGKVLFANRADEIRAPASITKVMSLYLVFDALQSGRINWNTQMPVSKRAASRPRMRLGMPAGSTISVRDAVNAMIVLSANDASVVVAEYLGGTEDNFARIMTMKARSLGMRNTTFKNANGLPAQGHVSSARDIALMSIAMREHFPQYYNLFSQRQFSYRGKVYNGHNRVLDRIDGADGLKTGFTNAAGYTITTSVAKNGKKLVIVVLGGSSGRQRDDVVVTLANAYIGSASSSGKKRLFSGWNVAQSAWKGIRSPKQAVQSNQSRANQTVADSTRANSPQANPTPVDDSQEDLTTASVTPSKRPAALPSKTVIKSRTTVEIPVGQSVQGQAPEMVEQAPTTFGQAPTTMAYADNNQQSVTELLDKQVKQNYIVEVASLPDAKAANGFLKTIKSSLKDAKIASLGRVEPTTMDGRKVYSVRFGSFASEDAASAVCDKLTVQAFSCFVVAR